MRRGWYSGPLGVAAVLGFYISAARAQLGLDCVAPEQPWRLHLMDTGGDGWEGATLRLVDRETDVPAFIQAADSSGSITLTEGDGSSAFHDICIDPSRCYSADVVAGRDRDEVQWTLSNSTDHVFLVGDARASSLTVGECPCLPDQFAIRVVMTDQYGDGWNGIRLSIRPDAQPETSLTLPEGASLAQDLCLPMAGCYVVHVPDGMRGDEVHWLIVDPENPIAGQYLEGGSPYDDAFLGNGACLSGCTDPVAQNYEPSAQLDDRTCQYVDGCMDSLATNFNSQATRQPVGEPDVCQYDCPRMLNILGLQDRSLDEGGCLSSWAGDQADISVIGAQILFGSVQRPRYDGKFTVQDTGVLVVRWITFTDRLHGAIVAYGESSIYVHNCRFDNGRSRTPPDATTGWMAGGAIHVEGGFLEVKSTEFVGNAAYASSAFTYGGAIFAANSPTVEVDDCKFESNQATRGGAIYINGGSLLVTNSIFDIHESTVGGCIEAREAQLTITDSKLERSVTRSISASVASPIYSAAPWWGDVSEDLSGVGGSVCAIGGSLHISGCTIEENMAELRGGAILGIGVDVVIETTFFTRNTHIMEAGEDAVMDGGAVHVSGGSLVMDGCFFDGNLATVHGHGDAVYVEGVSAWLIIDTSFTRVDPYHTVYTTASPVAGCAEQVPATWTGASASGYPCDPGFQCQYSRFSIGCSPCPSINITVEVAVTTVSEDGITCHPCAPGFTNALDRAGCEPCPTSKYSTGGVCLTCPIGYAPNADQTDCDPCPQGFYSGMSASTGERITSCVRCSRGYQPNLLLAATGCEACAVGRVGTTGSSCTVCPPGTGPELVNAVASTRCQACEDGKYAVLHESGSRCALCPAGKQARNLMDEASTDACTECAPGLYSLEGQACTTCDAGTQPNSPIAATLATGCEPCSSVHPGYFSGSGRSCVGCPAGKEPNRNATACKSCMPGSASRMGEICATCTGNAMSNEARNDTDPPVLAGVECVECGGGSTTNSNHTACSCGVGEYDMNLGLFVCFGKHWDQQILEGAQRQLYDDILNDKTCTPCPWCMDCTDPAEPKTRPGYEFVHTSVGFEFFRLHTAARRKQTTRGILQCPVEGACLGSSVLEGQTLETCITGHGGALCSACTSAEVPTQTGLFGDVAGDGSTEVALFFRDGRAGVCERCPSWLNFNIPVIVVFIVFSVGLLWTYKVALPKMQWLHVVYSQYPRELGLQADLKTMVGLSQMLCLMPSLLQLEFPSVYAAALNYVGLVFLDLRRVAHWDCYASISAMSKGSVFFSDYEFYVLFLPLVLLVAIAVFHLSAKKQVMAISNMREHMEASSQLQSTTVSRLSLAIFLVYPMITAVAVGANLCVELSESYHVLASDYAVRCDPGWLALDDTCTGTPDDGGDCSSIFESFRADTTLASSGGTRCIDDNICGLFGTCTDGFCEVDDPAMGDNGCPTGCEYAGSSNLNWMRTTTPILIGVITIGFPCFVFVSIFVSKKGGPATDPDGLNESLSADDEPSKPPQPLFACFGEDFKPGYRMFEVVEYVRKALYAGLLGAVSPGSVEQIYYGVGLSLVCLVLYAGLQPYALAKCNVVKTAAEVQLLLSLVTALALKVRNEARSDQLGGPENADGYDVFLAMVTFVLTPLPLIYCNWKHAQKLSAEGEAGALEARLQYLIANGGASDIVSMKDEIIEAHRAEIERLRAAVVEFGGGEMGLDTNPLGGESEFEKEFRSLQYTGDGQANQGLALDQFSSGGGLSGASDGRVAPGDSGRALAIKKQGNGGSSGESESSEEESSESSDSDSDGEVKPRKKALRADDNKE
jgi:predicted outer membrane repeat protein